MTKRSHLLIFAIALSTLGQARAEESNFCASLPALANLIKDCQQNVFFVKAADVCEIKLQKEIAAQQALLTGAMAFASVQAGSSQSARIANSNADLNRMRATLEDLHAKAKRARIEMLNYGANFTYPGPISKRVAERLHMDKFLGSFHCYADNQEYLGMTVKDVESHIADFEKALKSTAPLVTKNAESLKKMDASSLNKKVTGVSNTRTPAAVPSGHSKNVQSDITGTERKPDSLPTINK
jgi:hypothetical protein